MPDETIWDQKKGPKPRDPQPVDEPVDEASIPAELMGGEEPPEPHPLALSEEQEQAIRDGWGYTASETRTKAERDEAAARMISQSAQPMYEGELPEQVANVWHGENEKQARVYIAAWGMDAFLTSQIHIAAIKQHERHAKMEPIRAAFIKAKKEKG